MLEFRKSYIAIPTIGIFATIIYSIFSFSIQWNLNYILLDRFDFTGKTTNFLVFISIINICILLFDLYLVIMKKDNGFPYKFNKIFAIIFLLLAVTCIFSFIIIRNEEEKISVNNTIEFPETSNDIDTLKKIEKYLDMKEEKELDKFYKIKQHIANEVQYSNNKVERYISLIFPFISKGEYRVSRTERNYYMIIARFAILDFILATAFAYHIRDEYLEKQTNIRIEK